MGVRRALELTREQVFCSRAEQKKIYTLGPLIHNPQVLDELLSLGINILDENNLPENLSASVVIIRAHGISPQTEAELQKRGAVIVDATCPRVKTNQLKAAELAKNGYMLFIAGEKDHAEIRGIVGYAEQLEISNEKLGIKTALIGQTTISAEEYKLIGENLKKQYPDIEIIPSICPATTERQNSLKELLLKVDAVVIAGGRESANTRRLLQIAEKSGKPCVLAETPADIPPDFFKYKTIGLAAGASTPDKVIDEIETALKRLQLPIPHFLPASTISNAISPCRIPGIRAACPTVKGLTSENFSFASAERPGTAK